MAKLKLKFLDVCCDTSIEIFKFKETSTIMFIIENSEKKKITITLDKSTSIKFAKTLRTEINNITEWEVNNG